MGSSTIYSALPDNHVRILLVQGTKPIKRRLGQDLAIECITETASIDDVSGEGGSPGYDALSYVWGSRAVTRPIHCNGKLQWVTTNLYNALWHLLISAKKLPLRLWVDAICIDQQNHLEKSHQVQLMGRIYQSAQSVLVWLGVGSEQAGSHLDDFWKYLGGTLSKSSDEAQRDFANMSETQAEKAGRRWLSQCDWFARAWTLQEIVLARKARVIRGFDSVEWDTLVTYVRSQNTYQNIYETDVIAAGSDGLARWVLSIENIKEMCGFSSVRPSTSMPQNRSKRRRMSHCPFRIIMAHSQGRSSSNPHDKVYSLLGLYKGNWRFTVDYTQPVELTYVQCLVTMIEEEGSFPSEVLASLPRTPSPGHCSKTLANSLWVPDWGHLTLVDRYNLLEIDPGMALSSHPWGTRFLESGIVHDMKLDGHRLRAFGVILSYGASIGIEADGLNREEFTLRQIRQMLPSPQCVTSRASKKPSSSNRPHAGYLLDAQTYQPVSQSAQDVYNQLWLHETNDCSCVRSARSGLPIATHSGPLGRQELIERWKTTKGQTDKCMTWRCLVFGFEGIMTMQPNLDPATGELTCDPGLGFDYFDRKCDIFLDSFSQLEPIIRHLDQGNIYDGNRWRNLQDLTCSDRKRLNVSGWTCPEDIPIEDYDTVGVNEQSRVCWLPVRFSIPIK